MAQGPIQVKQNPSVGGNTPNYYVIATGALKTSPGRLCRVIPQALGTAGTWAFNDCAVVASAGTINQIAPLSFNALTVGVPVLYDWPCQTGIVVSAVPTGGAALSIAID